MSQGESGRKIGWLGLLLILVGLYALWLVISAGSEMMSPRRSRPDSLTAGPTDQPQASLDGIIDSFRRNPDREAFQNGTQQLNAYLGQQTDRKFPPLSKEDRARLKRDLDLDDSELDELASGNFTQLDVFHLEQCFLLRDVAKALVLENLSERDRAMAAFGWVVRQVRLRPEQPKLLPPDLVLRRGFGNASERALVFLELLRQAEVPGVLLMVSNKGETRAWLPAAIVNGELLLFDTRLGVPVPGPGGQSVATLAQVRGNADLLEALRVDADHAYDVTWEQSAQVEALVACPLSFLSPRMRWLQESLGPACQVRVADDPAKVADLARKALGNDKVRFWSRPNDPDVPTRTLRESLPLADRRKGEIPRYVELFYLKIVPREAFPPVFKSIPPQLDIGARLQMAFTRPFEDLSINPGAPTELLVHGRYIEAIQKLVDTMEDARKVAEEAEKHPDLKDHVEQWTKDVQTTYAEMIRAERDVVQASGDAAQERLQKARGRFIELTRYPQEAGFFMRMSVQEVLTRKAAYMLAQCKHEQAEQAQANLDRSPNALPPDAEAVRDAWQAAADAWQSYIDQCPPGAAEPEATLGRARALYQAGQKEAAANLLAHPPKLTSWNETAWLYRARHLKDR
jgi:hypothetical protein